MIRKANAQAGPARHLSTGLCLVLFLAGMANTPRELYEAARLDGAGHWRSLIVYPFLQRHFIRGMVEGAVR